MVSLTAEVARTYVTFRTFEALVELARSNAKLQEKALEIAQSRFNNGVTTELDPTQATTLLETTRATIPKLETGRQQTRNALCTLLGQPTGTVDGLLLGPKEIPKAPAKVAVGVPAEMLRRRPDVRSAELAAASQCARIGVAKADLYPSFTLLGDVGLETASTGGAPHNFFSTSSIFYSLGPRINWPFFNYGRLENKARVEDARFQQLLVGYHNVVLKAAQEVEDAMAGFLNAQDASGFEQNAVKSAERAVELAMTQYFEGATDYQRVIDAQRSLLERQNTLAQTSSEVATNLIALYKALGGGWESRLEQPLVPASTEQEMRDRTRWGNMLAPAARGTGSSVSVGMH
jgi:NodT family efflux transporter outer membrane factor (OMF) lipoprotein